MNQVITHQEGGRVGRYPTAWPGRPVIEYVYTARPAITSVGTRTVQARVHTSRAVRTKIAVNMIERVRFLFPDHNGVPRMLTLKYGITTRATTTSVGMMIPATNGGK